MSDHSRIDDLRRRVQSDPASIAFAALAEEYRRAGQYDEAIAVCADGLKRHPSYLSAHVTLGLALLESGRVEDARDALAFVLRAAPENLAAIHAMAEIKRRTDGEARPPSHSPWQVSAPVAAAPVAIPPTVLPAVQALESFLDAVRKAR